ncbi:SPS-sensor component PTR3 [Spathaspora sp. JA1]|nr:SPS-sensor component PTR3 [Spathaspora sp. JA1]
MDKASLTSLENLLKFPGTNTADPIADASILTCGCLVSEAIFLQIQHGTCPNCKTTNVSILSEIKPLRDLYNLIVQFNAVPNYSFSSRRRRSSSKKSIKEEGQPGGSGESMDLLSLFYKFAKEEEFTDKPSASQTPAAPAAAAVPAPRIEPGSQPIEIQQNQSVSTDIDIGSLQIQHSPSASPHNNKLWGFDSDTTAGINYSPDLKFEKNLLQSIGEQKEYNFSKCFPFHRKLSTFPMLKFNFSAMVKSGSSIKKAISTYIHSYHDFNLGKEITRFVLINSKRWELYEYSVSITDIEKSPLKPQLILCGKSTGEYSDSVNGLNQPLPKPTIKEIIIRNEFGVKQAGDSHNDVEDMKKRLLQWDQIDCYLTKNYLVITGTKGVLRVFNVNKTTSSYLFGQPIYTYLTNFPIRCVSVSPNEALIACGITAKERLSGKEQPFVILHTLGFAEGGNYVNSVNPITITIPYRDPIKLLSFNASSSHLICGTSWESRYLVIKLKSSSSGEDSYRKPRLIWSDFIYKSARRNKPDGGLDDGKELGYDEKTTDADNELMLSNEGMTDLQFGNFFSNAVIVTSCSLKSRPPMIIHLEGAMIDSSKSHSSVVDNFSIQNSMTSGAEDEQDYSSIKSAEIIMKIPEIGSLIHRFALSPTGDGIVFLSKDGNVYLLSGPNFKKRLSTTSIANSKKIVVLLGEVANSERFSEAASIKFSPDGGKVFAIDRKGVFSVFDFTKGVPGHDPDVIKCKIINL